MSLRPPPGFSITTARSGPSLQAKEAPREQRPQFILGIDLGELRDYTALVVLEVKKGDPSTYDCRHLERIPLGAGYPEQVEYIAQLVKSLRAIGNVRIAVDATGVGRPVIEMLRPVVGRLNAITLTGGDAVTEGEDREYRAPKRDVVAATKVLLQCGRLRIAEALPLASVLVEELLAFEVRISPRGHDSYAAGRESEHDDLVLALALAVWLAEHGRRVRLLL
jgi:phage FluMu gp28-like protein